MTKIKNEAYTPKDIGEIKFRIPLYQRPYAWESSQVNQLLKDLFDSYEKNKENKYYLGILSIGKTQSDENLYDLIDGQQRITTLYLIGKYLEKETEKETEKEKEIEYWRNFLNNRLDLYGRSEDKAYLENLEKNNKINPKMIEAINTIKLFFETIKDTKGFSIYIYKHAAFFLSKVPDKYTVVDKNLQFVRMNNRGKQLESHEILKIKLAKTIEDTAAKSDFVNMWNEVSQMGCGRSTDQKKLDKSETSEDKPKTLGELLKDESNNENKEVIKEEEIFYSSIVSFPEFLLIALQRFSEKPPLAVSHSKEKLLEEFGFGEKKIAWTGLVVEFGKLLKEQFELFTKFFIKRDKEEKYILPDQNSVFGEEEPDPTNTGKKDTFITQLKKFQSYLYVSTVPHKWLVEAFGWLQENKDNNFNSKKFLSKLKCIDNSNHAADEINSMSYPKIDRYWFWRLDYYLWENRLKCFDKDEKAIEVAGNYAFRVNRSIEHVAPQHPEKDSMVKVGDSLHSFGNLVMISSGQNSSLKNYSFEMKKAHVESFLKEKKTGTIESLKLLKIMCTKGEWGDEAIKTHQKEMIEILIASFPKEETGI